MYGDLNLMNYWRRIVLSVFIIEIFKLWLLKYLNFWMNYPHTLWMKSSRRNCQPHTIWGIKMNYIKEIPKQWRMGLSQSRLWHLKSGQYCLRNWKTLNLYILSKNLSGIGNQTVHVGYGKPTCNMLVLHNNHVSCVVLE